MLCAHDYYYYYYVIFLNFVLKSHSNITFEHLTFHILVVCYCCCCCCCLVAWHCDLHCEEISEKSMNWFCLTLQRYLKILRQNMQRARNELFLTFPKSQFLLDYFYLAFSQKKKRKEKQKKPKLNTFIRVNSELLICNGIKIKSLWWQKSD